MISLYRWGSETQRDWGTCTRSHSFVLDLGLKPRHLDFKVYILVTIPDCLSKLGFSIGLFLILPKKIQAFPLLNIFITLLVFIIFCFEYLLQIQPLNILFLLARSFGKDHSWVISSPQETRILGLEMGKQ